MLIAFRKEYRFGSNFTYKLTVKPHDIDSNQSGKSYH